MAQRLISNIIEAHCLSAQYVCTEQMWEHIILTVYIIYSLFNILLVCPYIQIYLIKAGTMHNNLEVHQFAALSLFHWSHSEAYLIKALIQRLSVNLHSILFILCKCELLMLVCVFSGVCLVCGDRWWTPQLRLPPLDSLLQKNTVGFLETLPKASTTPRRSALNE